MKSRLTALNRPLCSWFAPEFSGPAREYGKALGDASEAIQLYPQNVEWYLLRSQLQALLKAKSDRVKGLEDGIRETGGGLLVAEWVDALIEDGQYSTALGTIEARAAGITLARRLAHPQSKDRPGPGQSRGRPAGSGSRSRGIECPPKNRRAGRPASRGSRRRLRAGRQERRRAAITGPRGTRATLRSGCANASEPCVTRAATMSRTGSALHEMIKRLYLGGLVWLLTGYGSWLPAPHAGRGRFVASVGAMARPARQRGRSARGPAGGMERRQEHALEDRVARQRPFFPDRHRRPRHRHDRRARSARRKRRCLTARPASTTACLSLTGTLTS